MQKSIYKLYALRRIRPFLSKEKARLLANAFIDCQFLYAPLIWMFSSKSSVNKICKIHFRTLQIANHSMKNRTKSYLL